MKLETWKALATNLDRIYEKKLKLEGTQIELIHKYINPLLNIAHVTEFKTKNQKYIQHTKNQKETHVTKCK